MNAQNPSPFQREADGSLRLTRHADVMRALLEHDLFSSAVSAKHPAIPNGRDPSGPGRWTGCITWIW